MDRDHLTLKTFMAITAERDAAIQERNMALEERKRAFAERDMAMLQRDAAVAERNAATKERDEAISSLQFRGTSVNGSSIIPVLLGEEHATEATPKHVQFQKQIDMPESIYIRRECLGGGEIAEAPNAARAKRDRQQKDGKATKFCKSPKILVRMAEELSQQLVSTSPEWWNNEHYSAASDDEHLDQQLSWKDDLGLNQITFDESTMPVPVCSCTGSTQPCYRWGSGGWQSACCTTKISMYPLPQIANKRYSRVGGRKMSGSAFIKLLNRVAAQGYDFSEPLDLKHHWAKHGTNRYTTLK